MGLRTDAFNFRSQRAIEGLGAKKDGVIRHYGATSSCGYGVIPCVVSSLSCWTVTRDAEAKPLAAVANLDRGVGPDAMASNLVRAMTGFAAQ